MQKEEETGVEHVLERMVKGMRNEMNTVIWKIEHSRDVSPVALKNMVKNGLDAIVEQWRQLCMELATG